MKERWAASCSVLGGEGALVGDSLPWKVLGDEAGEARTCLQVLLSLLLSFSISHLFDVVPLERNHEIQKAFKRQKSSSIVQPPQSTYH